MTTIGGDYSLGGHTTAAERQQKLNAMVEALTLAGLGTKIQTGAQLIKIQQKL